ncbi:hypothetical protein GCM10009733_087720 [Nonomuraea maheshkhaliensis]|uniref:NmrA-like domain-containing protein n=1 Tax=Nonomuraea maheshkhaliensis TaxID=419590 RepID=A0ABN2GV22_9ACTN
MNVLVIGATGFVGGAVARHLAAQGHTVTGLARTGEAAAPLAAQGITPLSGDLPGPPADGPGGVPGSPGDGPGGGVRSGTYERDHDRFAAAVTAAGQADAVIYAAQPDPETEERTVAGLLDALAGTGKTFVFTSGAGVLIQRTGGSWSEDGFGEDDPFEVEPLAAGASSSRHAPPHRRWRRGPRARCTTRSPARSRTGGSPRRWRPTWAAAPAA